MNEEINTEETNSKKKWINIKTKNKKIKKKKRHDMVTKIISKHGNLNLNQKIAIQRRQNRGEINR